MNIVIYTKNACPNCTTAKQLLKSKGREYDTVDADFAPYMADLLRRHPDARQMPQCFVMGQRVGGLAGLQAALTQVSL